MRIDFPIKIILIQLNPLRVNPKHRNLMQMMMMMNIRNFVTLNHTIILTEEIFQNLLRPFEKRFLKYLILVRVDYISRKWRIVRTVTEVFIGSISIYYANIETVKPQSKLLLSRVKIH